MAIRCRFNPEPFSLQAGPGNQAEPILANSQAGAVLERELRRYCEGGLRGRSFLISGHRGAGKTTMVDNTVLRLQRDALSGQLPLKPLPVYLQGPTLFATGQAKQQEASQGGDSAAVSVKVAVGGNDAAAPSAAANGDDGETNLVLIQGVQALHQAVAKEYSSRLHRLARLRLGRASHAAAADMVELAARFQIELTEAPPEARLHEFWRQAGVLDAGILFDLDRGRQQGLRELVALVGLNHVHQRISGKLSEKDERRASASRTRETSVVAEPKWPELAKPLSAVFAGTAVATAGASAGSLGWAAGLGLVTAIAALFVFRVSSTVKAHHERRQDRVFVPDLQVKTLHRVLPELFDRLAAAGLAPVFIVDELDKVDGLDDKIYPLILNLKKLFAEWSFTCLLVDRGFYERLHVREQQERGLT